MTKRESLIQIIRDAAINTLARSPGLRGPYIISDAELRGAIKAQDHQ